MTDEPEEEDPYGQQLEERYETQQSVGLLKSSRLALILWLLAVLPLLILFIPIITIRSVYFTHEDVFSNVAVWAHGIFPGHYFVRADIDGWKKCTSCDLWREWPKRKK